MDAVGKPFFLSPAAAPPGELSGLGHFVQKMVRQWLDPAQGGRPKLSLLDLKYRLGDMMQAHLLRTHSERPSPQRVRLPPPAARSRRAPRPPPEPWRRGC